MALLEVPDPAVVAPAPDTRWEIAVSFVASILAIVVIGGGLLVLTAELRNGWVPGHELPMDKAAAIHKLLFRE